MKKFIDEVYFQVKAGNGGNGNISFERYKFQPIGKPGGGDGGRGGHIIFKVDSNMSDLSHLKHSSLIKAKNGENGGTFKKTGKDGEDVYVILPEGVIIKDYNTRDTIKELIQDKEEFIVATGGEGGKGNVHFKSSTNRSPQKATKGEKGEGKKIILELKLLADIGLVGFPNAGKSTLLKNMTEAKPEIAEYPFTTLAPNLGIFYNEKGKAIRMADIPGLIKDSHKGKGLGIQFLRHIERTKMLCIILDISEKDYHEKLNVLLNELNNYNPALLQKGIIYVGNKIDLIEEIPEELMKDFILISALKKTNLDKLKEELIKLIKKDSSLRSE